MTNQKRDPNSNSSKKRRAWIEHCEELRRQGKLPPRRGKRRKSGGGR